MNQLRWVLATDELTVDLLLEMGRLKLKFSDLRKIQLGHTFQLDLLPPMAAFFELDLIFFSLRNSHRSTELLQLSILSTPMWNYRDPYLIGPVCVGQAICPLASWSNHTGGLNPCRVCGFVKVERFGLHGDVLDAELFVEHLAQSIQYIGNLLVFSHAHMAGEHVHSAGDRPDVQVVNLMDFGESADRFLNFTGIDVFRSRLHEDVNRFPKQSPGGVEHQQSDDDRGNRVGDLPVRNRIIANGVSKTDTMLNGC